MESVYFPAHLLKLCMESLMKCETCEFFLVYVFVGRSMSSKLVCTFGVQEKWTNNRQCLE